MSEHIDRKKLVSAIRSTAKRRQVIAECALDDIDVKILTMRHIQFKAFDYIADEVGLSVSQVGRRYRRALQAIVEIAQEK